MRLICPHCMNGVTVPDDTAGKEAVCPSCGKSFPTPSRYSAAVVPDASQAVAGSIEPARSTPHPEPPAPPPVPSAPPGYVPPAPLEPSGFLAPPGASPETPTPAGYTKTRGLTFSPKVIGWLPAVFLTLALALTFFPWVGSYLGGAALYSQGPWRAMFGAVGRNIGLEQVAPISMTGWAEKVRSDWVLMVPFLLLLILVTLFALAERGFSSLDPRKVPPLASLWPARHTIIAALSVAVMALILVQSLNGFGLERAARQAVRENAVLVKEREEAQGNEWKLAVVDYKEDQELARLNVRRTIWMHLAVMCIALGALAAICTVVLERRGTKPPPKLVLHS